jgi:hypothetical protein
MHSMDCALVGVGSLWPILNICCSNFLEPLKIHDTNCEHIQCKEQIFSKVKIVLEIYKLLQQC